MKLIVLFIFIFSLNQIYAHPHMFVDVQPYLLSTKDGSVNIHVKWYFDDFTSEGFLIDYDENENLVLDSSEKKEIRRDSMGELKKHGYFITAKLNGRKVIPKISNLKIDSKMKKSDKPKKSINDIISGQKTGGNNKIVVISYEFDIQISGSLNQNNKLSLSFYDDTLYGVLFPMKKMIPSKGIILKSSNMTKEKCLYEVTF